MRTRETDGDHLVSGHDVCMIGVFPPPVHGMAMLNAGMYEEMSARGSTPIAFDLAPASLERSWYNRLSRIPKIMRALVRYAWELVLGRGDTLYIALSGGWGQLYEALFVALARLRSARIFLHHHSFAYVDRPKAHARLLTWIAGPVATNVVGCDRQGQKLRQLYPNVVLTMVVSNPAIIWRNADVAYRKRDRVQTVGFLGNISHEKGILEVIAVAEEFERRGVGLEVYVAGPFESVSVEEEVRAAVARLKSLRYLGPRYGADKESFWQSIDVLLFPSKYANETAPVVVLEAIGHGVPVVGWDRGCMATMLSSASGLVIQPDHDFVESAVECLLSWRSDPTTFGEASSSAGADFIRQHADSRSALDVLLKQLCGEAPPAQTQPSIA